MVWFSDLSTYAKDLPRLFHKLAQLSRAGEDVFEYLKQLALKRVGKKAAKLGRIAKYLELKPNVFGISIDVGKVVEDISDAVAG